MNSSVGLRAETLSPSPSDGPVLRHVEGVSRPILFSGPMVRALLTGAKTQTRRTVKNVPSREHYGRDIMDWDLSGIHQDEADLAGTDRWALDVQTDVDDYHRRIIRCPYGKPGDTLSVRETCRAEELSRPPQERPATRRERQAMGRTTVIAIDELDGTDGVRYLADNAWVKIENTRQAGEAWSALYHYRGRGKGGIGNQVPSIHMPRWASRIALRITDVRVERLQDISERDALAEGMTFPEGMAYGSDPVDAFRGLWGLINGPGSWGANPWVWAVSFERVGAAALQHAATGPTTGKASGSQAASRPNTDEPQQ